VADGVGESKKFYGGEHPLWEGQIISCGWGQRYYREQRSSQVFRFPECTDGSHIQLSRSNLDKTIRLCGR